MVVESGFRPSRGDLVYRVTEPNKLVPEKVVLVTKDEKMALVRWVSCDVFCEQWVSVKVLRRWEERPGGPAR